MREVKLMQKSVNLILPRSHFGKLVREIMEDETSKQGCPMKRIQRQALEALQEAAENHMVKQFEMGNLLAIHANRVTVRSSDLVLGNKIKEL